MLLNSGSQAVTPEMLSKFARTARQRIHLEGGGYRRDHLRALAQRVEVAEGEVRIMGSKSRLLQTLVANNGANAVPTQGLKWRREGFESSCIQLIQKELIATLIFDTSTNTRVILPQRCP